MKWCFLINNFQVLPEFFGKLAGQALNKGDECLVVFSSKIAEFEKTKFFPAGAKLISMVDWFIDNYQEGKEDFFGVSWKDFFPLFERNPLLKLDYNKSIKTTLRIIQFYQFIFEKEKPDVIINEPPSGLGHLIAYYFSKKHNAKYLSFSDPRLDTTVIDVYDKKFTCSKYKETFEKLSSDSISKKEKERAESFVKKFISHEVAPSAIGSSKIYFSQIGLMAHFLKRISQVNSSLFRYVFSRKKYKLFDIESEIALKLFFRAFFNAQKRKFRIFSQKRFFKAAPSQKEKYFLLPLHYQPEAATDVFAIYYCDQLNAAKNIAFSLPFPHKLYVKEHPAGVGTRAKKFYEELKKIPNIVLISPDENVENVIKNSSGVVTLTSTLGLEAALAGKPVYVLGEVFYSYHPLCRQVSGFEELKNSIEKDLANKPNSIDNLADINNRFLASYFRNTILGNMAQAITKEDTNDYVRIYQDLVNNFLRKDAK